MNRYGIDVHVHTFSNEWRVAPGRTDTGFVANDVSHQRVLAELEQACLTVDAGSGQILAASAGARRVLKDPEGRLGGMSVRQLLDSDLQGAYDDLHRDFQETGAAQRSAMKLRRLDGQLAYFSVFVRKLRESPDVRQVIVLRSLSERLPSGREFTEAQQRELSLEELVSLLESSTAQRALPTRTPCGSVIAASEAQRERVGHENAGFLSWHRGFVPAIAPLERLSGEFAVWDEVGRELAQRHSDLGLRRRVEGLPVLDAGPERLPEHEVLRACALLAILAQSYWYVQTRPPRELPAAIAKPWEQLRQRLGRGAPVLSYIDLIVYNWKLLDDAAIEPIRVENLQLLIPTVDTREESVFYLTQLEILSRCAPMVGWIAAAQQAVVERNDRELIGVLEQFRNCMELLVRISLPKINPHPWSKTQVAPVAWAKTVAPFAVPIHAGDQGPSGTSSPIFSALDLFFGRRQHESFLGREIVQLRTGYPAWWKAYLEAVGRVDLRGYVEQHGAVALKEAWRDTLHAYAGSDGFLGRHRMKVYGYLELAFKVGRALTIGGFGGAFRERTWDQVDGELRRSQRERGESDLVPCQHARVSAAGVGEPAAVLDFRLHLDAPGPRLKPGDHCAVYPRNPSALVAQVLRALRACGDERVALTTEWRTAAQLPDRAVSAPSLSVREVLELGDLWPVSARTTEAIHALTQSASLLSAVRSGEGYSGTLHELIDRLRADGFNPEALWRPTDTGPSDRLCRLIPPGAARLYSVASAGGREHGQNSTLSLVVGAPVARDAQPGAAVPPVTHAGCTPQFLERAAVTGETVAVQRRSSLRFRPPEDPRELVVFFAGGSGIAPFLGLLENRLRSGEAGKHWLFWSLRGAGDLVGLPLLERAQRSGLLELSLCFTRENQALVADAAGALGLRSGRARRISELIEEAMAQGTLEEVLARGVRGEATFYICGSTGFAGSVYQALLAGQVGVRAEGAFSKGLARRELLFRLLADRRLNIEVHTRPVDRASLPLIDLSQVALHNDDAHGHWMVLAGRVYDLTEFAWQHPGGRQIVQAYAGLDATHGYERAHSARPDVDAMREMHCIGQLRQLELEEVAIDVVAADAGVSSEGVVSCRSVYGAWSVALSLIVEMQNALRLDYSFLETPATAAESAACVTAYRVARAVETHRRFLLHYERVLKQDSLPALWRTTRPLVAPCLDAGWLESELQAATQGHGFERASAVAEALAALVDDGRELDLCVARVRALRASDEALLLELKQAALTAVKLFERHERQLQQRGLVDLLGACSAMVQAFARRHRELARLSVWASVEPASPHGRAGVGQPQLVLAYSSRHWRLEGAGSEPVGVLRRTPAAWSTLEQTECDLRPLLAALDAQPRGRGMVVDMREAPLRNDPGFEGALRPLRRLVTTRFERVAVLVQSPGGELQVQRIEREEGRQNTLATRNESSAFKFAAGGR